MVRLDLIGGKFSKLTVVRFGYVDKKRQWRWECICDCGKLRVVESYKLRNGSVTSCGCFRRKPQVTHLLVEHDGRKNGKITTEYRTWQKMKERCYTQSCPAFKDYGARGIKVCDRWLSSFQNFFDDVGAKPGKEYTIDRFPNNDGNYEPGNVRWATKKQQAGNTRRNHWFKTNDGKCLILTDLAKELLITTNTIHNRINSGKSPFESGRGKLVLDTQTGVFYDSAKEAAQAKNINPYYLRGQLSGNCKNKTSLIYA